MAYTRSFPIAVEDFRPGNNPVYTGKCYVDIAISTSGVFGISTSNLAAATLYTEPILVIYAGDTSNAIVGNYAISMVLANGFALTDLAGGAVTLVNGTYHYRLFDGAFPNSNDLPCEAILFSTAPTSDVEAILVSGQFVAIDATAFIAGAIYNISVAEIIDDGGGVGVLLGTYGINGTAYIS